MVGVAGPLLRRSRLEGARFLTGLAAGGAAAGLLLSIPIYFLGSLLQAAAPQRARILVLLVICAALGFADLTRRTPQAWRQVPVGLIWKLRPGALGLAWGFDLGLLATTQKATSLIWAAVAAVILMAPSSAAIVLVTMALAMCATIAVASLAYMPGNPSRGKGVRERLGMVRLGSGVTILSVVMASALQMLWT